MRPPEAPDQPFPWLAHPGRAGRHAGRMRVLRRVAAAAIAVATLAAIAGARDLLARAESAAGPLQTVTVARQPMTPGATVEAGDLEARSLPAGAVPDDLADAPIGRIVVADIYAGEPLIEARLAPPDAAGGGAMLRRDEQAVAIPAEVVMPPLVPGDPVLLIDTDDPASAATTATGRVIAVGELAVVVAVPTADAAPIAVAASAGRVAVTVRHRADG